MMLHNAHIAELHLCVTVISCDLGLGVACFSVFSLQVVLVCLVCKSAVQVNCTCMCELQNIMPCFVRVCMHPHVSVCAYACVCVCVCVCGSLHRMNEIVTLLNLTLFITCTHG